MRIIAAAVVVTALCTFVASRQIDRPVPYIMCRSSEDCNQGECCVIGMERYSIPRCKPHVPATNSCRPQSEPRNLTVYYPNNPDGVELTNVYVLYCPCSGDLVCGTKTATCVTDSSM